MSLNGFYNAPASKFLWSTVLIVSLAGILGDYSHYLWLDTWKLLSSLELWRIFTHSFSCLTAPDLILSLILIYTFRELERFVGTLKFANLIFWSIFISTSLGLFLSAVVVLPLSNNNANHIEVIRDGSAPDTDTVEGVTLPTLSSGPYAVIFACLPMYFKYIPKPRNTSLLSEKSIMYILCIILMFSWSSSSLLSCLIGLGTGLLTSSSSSLPVIRLPQSISKLLTTIYSSIDSRRGNNGNNDGAMDGHATQATEVADGDVRRQRAPVRRDAGNGGEVANLRFNLPSDENIAILTSMGFQQEAVVNALVRSQNDVDAAANLLLQDPTAFQPGRR